MFYKISHVLNMNLTNDIPFGFRKDNTGCVICLKCFDCFKVLFVFLCNLYGCFYVCFSKDKINICEPEHFLRIFYPIHTHARTYTHPSSHTFACALQSVIVLKVQEVNPCTIRWHKHRREKRVKELIKNRIPLYFLKQKTSCQKNV